MTRQQKKKMRLIKYDDKIIGCIEAVDDITIRRLLEDIVFEVADAVARKVCDEIQDILHKEKDDKECCMKVQDYCLSVLCTEDEIEDYNYSLERKQDNDTD